MLRFAALGVLIGASLLACHAEAGSESLAGNEEVTSEKSALELLQCRFNVEAPPASSDPAQQALFRQLCSSASLLIALVAPAPSRVVAGECLAGPGLSRTRDTGYQRFHELPECEPTRVAQALISTPGCSSAPGAAQGGRWLKLEASERSSWNRRLIRLSEIRQDLALCRARRRVESGRFPDILTYYNHVRYTEAWFANRAGKVDALLDAMLSAIDFLSRVSALHGNFFKSKFFVPVRVAMDALGEYLPPPSTGDLQGLSEEERAKYAPDGDDLCVGLHLNHLEVDDAVVGLDSAYRRVFPYGQAIALKEGFQRLQAWIAANGISY